MAGGLWIDGERVPYERLPPPSDVFPPHINEALSFVLEWREGFGSIDLRTSGTTGNSRSHAFTREQLAASARLTAETFELQVEDWLAVCLPLTGTGGRMQLVRGLVLGLWIHVEAPSSLPFQYLPDGDWATTSLVPLQLRALLESEEGPDALARFRFVLIGGAPMPPDLEARLRTLDLPLAHTYGLSETASHVAYRWLCGPQATGDYQLLTGVKAQIDEHERLILTPTYMGLDSIYTGDRARLTAQDRFEVLGRVDDVINCGGLKHDPLVLEQTYAELLNRAGLQFPLAVVGQPDPVLGEALAVVLEAKKTPRLERDVLDALRDLEGKTRPKAVYFLSAFPYSAAGKLDRRALRELLFGL